MCSEAAPAGVTSCRQVCDIAAAARDIVALLAPLGPEGFVITVDSATPVLVAGDRNDLFRVLFNLLHNGLMVARSDPKLRRIDIGFQREGAITVVRIADDGGGLPPDVAANLFRPFAKSHAKSHAKSAADHGWGLPIARELAERNGGMLSYEPSRRGASFRLVLATATAPPPAKAPSPARWAGDGPADRMRRRQGRREHEKSRRRRHLSMAKSCMHHAAGRRSGRDSTHSFCRGPIEIYI